MNEFFEEDSVKQQAEAEFWEKVQQSGLLGRYAQRLEVRARFLETPPSDDNVRSTHNGDERLRDSPAFLELPAPPAPAPLDTSATTLRGQKNLEYRSRPLREMGTLLIHAAATRNGEVLDNVQRSELAAADLTFGALLGAVDVVACHAVPGGDYAYQLAYPHRFREPVPYKGAASIFRVPAQFVAAALD